MRRLAEKAVFGEEKEKAQERIRAWALERGIFLSSTQKLYERIARGESRGFTPLETRSLTGFTVPAFNIRTLTFDAALALFRAAKKERAAAFIIELARSEMDYTSQAPEEFAACCLAAAVEEGFKGHLFLQGDHFELNREKYFSDEAREKEIRALENLINRAVSAGFYNIDIDCSNLVRSGELTVEAQQEHNFTQTANFVAFVRKKLERQLQNRLTVSVGGEVGEIGGENTTEKELQAFLRGFEIELAKRGDFEGLIKAAVQTGTSHGGVVLPSGKLKDVEADFQTLRELSEIARKHNLAGVVQHGASTLKDEDFRKFAKVGVLEIHLATRFQNVIFDSIYFPEDLEKRMYGFVEKQFPTEKQNYATEEQFYYKTRKKAWGPFKQEVWNLPPEVIGGICEELEEKFTFFFKALRVSDTQDLITEIYQQS